MNPKSNKNLMLYPKSSAHKLVRMPLNIYINRFTKGEVLFLSHCTHHSLCSC